MESKLERSLMYAPTDSVEENKEYFVVGDLEYLSSTALYGSGPMNIFPISNGFGNSGSEPLKSGGSEPLDFSNIEFPNVPIEPMIYGASKPLEPIKIDISNLPYELPKVSSKPLDSPKIDYSAMMDNLKKMDFPIVGSKPLGSSGSGFSPASDFGIGPGIAKETEGFIERYRAPENHEPFGEHINLGYLVPKEKTESRKQKWFDFNIHIDFNDED